MLWLSQIDQVIVVFLIEALELIRRHKLIERVYRAVLLGSERELLLGLPIGKVEEVVELLLRHPHRAVLLVKTSGKLLLPWRRLLVINKTIRDLRQHPSQCYPHALLQAVEERV